MLPLITESYLIYWNHTSHIDCESCARQSTTGPCAPTVSLVAANFVITTYFISLLLLQPLIYPLVLLVY
jgi:hypothetical protein